MPALREAKQTIRVPADGFSSKGKNLAGGVTGGHLLFPYVVLTRITSSVRSSQRDLQLCSVRMGKEPDSEGCSPLCHHVVGCGHTESLVRC